MLALHANGGGGYSFAQTIEVCALPKRMVLSRYGLKYGKHFDHFDLTDSGQQLRIFLKETFL